MKKTNQKGFTLVELIIVIVILGILAVTASPKLLDIQGDARGATLDGLEASLKGSVNIVYSKALIRGETGAANKALTGTTDVTVDYGYPQHDVTTITAIIDATTDWDIIADSATPSHVRIFPNGMAGTLSGAFYDDSATDYNACYLQYSMDDSADTNIPVYEKVITGC